ncbi:MAG: hypothetical protein HAW59_07200 [Betaproteobacteria bacterium]|nr:hypothetical protein [Betaproteobacteria bacterium]
MDGKNGIERRNRRGIAANLRAKFAAPRFSNPAEAGLMSFNITKITAVAGFRLSPE